MSWFDAAGLANIAKSALKEAQKTIDKALDIKDVPDNEVPANTPVDVNSEDFFETWGVTQSGTIKDSKKEIDFKQKQITSSIWGSFTGSFFDTTAKESKSASVESLDDSADTGIEHFSQSKLVVQQSEDDSQNLEEIENNKKNEDNPAEENIESVANSNAVPNQNTTVLKRHEKSSSSLANRLSIVSSESSKNSCSESVDIISSTNCTTTPESENFSAGHSVSNSSSAQGFKPTSESVEIIGDSLTSPSSVEVLGTDSTCSKHQSQSDEFVSPVCSPWSEEKSSPHTQNASPSSVEIIAEEQEENSINEDTMSYTSVSESTAVTVLDSVFNMQMKPPRLLKDTFGHSDTTEAVTADTSLTPDKSFNVADAITRAPSRSTMHLPLTQVNQVFIDTQPQGTRDVPSILQKTNIIDIPLEDDSISTSRSSETLLDTSIDDGSQSDKTLVCSESAMESSSDTSTATEASANSSYLKNMLADAMAERNSPDHQKIVTAVSPANTDSNSKSGPESSSISLIEVVPRENSPLSSESRSDLVKIGSDQTSCHTSGDELETTTSSDIEIISSPNGDSSSTHSRQSPAKQTLHCKTKSEDSTIDSLLHKMTLKKAKGHTRELSEASSVSDDSHSSEVDRLIKRISEMTEILETRESKLIDMNRRNAELQELNENLKKQLDSIFTKQLESANVSQVTEEYTQRLSALEKKFQQAIREKDTLRKQLEQAKQEAASRMSKGELDTLLAEKEETIKELREEGEKLSKQQLQHSNIIKKLRAKEKENESTIKHLKENVESLSTETDRLKKSLSAKDEVERSQIEAVHQLTNKNKKLENEASKLKGQLEDLTQKYETTKKSLDAAKKELIDKNRASSELQAREQLLESLETQKRMTESQNEEVISQLEDLRYKLQKSEEEFAKKEQKLRQENSNLLRRLEEAESRNEELSQSALETSKPLIRQLESLQSIHNTKVAQFEKLEREMSMKISEIQSKLHAASAVERAAKEECVNMRTKFADIEGQLNTAKHEIEMVKLQLVQEKTQKQLVEGELKSKIEALNDTVNKQKACIDEQEKQIMTLQQQLSLEKSANEMQRKQSTTQVPAPGDKSENQAVCGDTSSSRTPSNSPTLSLGKASVAESMGSSFWSQDEPFETSQAPRYTNMFEMQILQSNLKQREGEVQQLQWELNRREQERTLLESEISNLLTRVEELESKLAEFETIKTQFGELQQQYDTLCQLYGEKVEENEELKLDLVDVKEVYKSQIDELLKQQRRN